MYSVKHLCICRKHKICGYDKIKLMSHVVAKQTKMTCAPSEDTDQPWLLPSLTSVFAVRMKKLWVLSYPLSAQRRLGGCTSWSLSSLGAHTILFVLSYCGLLMLVFKIWLIIFIHVLFSWCIVSEKGPCPYFICYNKCRKINTENMDRWCKVWELYFPNTPNILKNKK